MRGSVLVTVTEDPAAPGAPASTAAAGRRKDAEDNRERIIDVALSVLFERPGASLGDIATAAGLARRTIYGHFPNRESLIGAMADTAQATLFEIVMTGEREGRSPEERYALFLLGAWNMDLRTGLMLKVGRAELGIEGVRTVMAPVNGKVADFVTDGQATGVFEDHLPPAALAPALQAVNFSLVESMLAGVFDGDAHAAAVTCLVAAGMKRRAAERVVARAATRMAQLLSPAASSSSA